MDFLALVFYSIVLILCGGLIGNAASRSRKLIVISFDAFKPVYLDEGIAQYFKQFYEGGVRATNMIPVFPTKTFVNHFSIATGLQPQKHGVTGNELFDRRSNKLLKYSYELFHYNEDIVPIWRLNEDRGGITGVYMWPGSDFAYQGKKCTFIKTLDKNIPLEDRADEVMTWLRQGANLIMFYIEQPDEEGHAYSPDSQNELNMVRRLDAFIIYLEQSLLLEGLDDITDIIILSDHGMLTVTPENFIDLYAIIDEATCKTYGTSPVLQVICPDDKLTEAYTNLSKAGNYLGTFKVYTDNTLLDRWYVRNTDRFGPIVAVAEPGYGFQDMYDLVAYMFDVNGVQLSMDTKYGEHGYDNTEPSMQPIFTARGPSFKKGVTVTTKFSNTDLYHLFCRLLGINTIKVDGTDRTDVWSQMLY